ncbi:MAG: type IV toxin-antitoxin system AbiEi family antitoxin [Variovorax sp.]
MNQRTKQDVGEEWPELLQKLLEGSPIIKEIAIDPIPRHSGPDGEAEFFIDGQVHRLVVECKSSGQPRYVHSAILLLGQEIFKATDVTRGLFVAPFVSPASRELLKRSNIGWLDLAGNARIVFPKFHLEIDRAERDPFASKREQRSLFYPKSARVLKLLLRPPLRLWRVAELASAADVSAGQVSNVRRALVEREWAHAEAREGLRLTNPRALLDAWRDEGLPDARAPYRGYTLTHGRTSDKAVEAAFEEAQRDGARLLLASHSVARRLAPFARVSGDYFYADKKGLEILKRHLGLKEVDKGENVTVYPFDDNGLMADAIEINSAIYGTEPIQTYLDLLETGERGREAAEHWRQERIEHSLQSA